MLRFNFLLLSWERIHSFTLYPQYILCWWERWHSYLHQWLKSSCFSLRGRRIQHSTPFTQGLALLLLQRRDTKLNPWKASEISLLFLTTSWLPFSYLPSLAILVSAWFFAQHLHLNPPETTTITSLPTITPILPGKQPYQQSPYCHLGHNWRGGER